jgi:hypothetical protein
LNHLGCEGRSAPWQPHSDRLALSVSPSCEVK